MTFFPLLLFSIVLHPHKSPPEPVFSEQPRHRLYYTITDEHGLLVQCDAHSNDPNSTDFDNCAVAPGRTLDEVIKTFIEGIHQLQKNEAQ